MPISACRQVNIADRARRPENRGGLYLMQPGIVVVDPDQIRLFISTRDGENTCLRSECISSQRHDGFWQQSRVQPIFKSRVEPKNTKFSGLSFSDKVGVAVVVDGQPLDSAKLLLRSHGRRFAPCTVT